jgi:hypothetical protein
MVFGLDDGVLRMLLSQSAQLL